MIDTQGYGIHKMFQSQKDCYLLMPDYDLSTADEAILNPPSTIIDESNSLLLLDNSDIDLATTVLLDKVQKGKAGTLTSEAIKFLRAKKFIEGRTFFTWGRLQPPSQAC